MHTFGRGVAVSLTAAIIGASLARSGLATEAQEGTPIVTGDTVGLDPIACWWRTSAAAVRVGEHFALVLTCAVVETQTTRVVADLAQLDPSVLQLSPFQVVDGSPSADLRSATRRFFQYEYTLRVIGEDVIGTDVAIPELTIPYRVETRVADGTVAGAGRDRTYVLPPLPVHVLSLVPAATAQIRDQPGVSFRTVDEHQFRARAYAMGATSLYLLSALLILASLAQGWSRRRRSVVDTRPSVSAGAVLRRIDEVMGQLQRERASKGWTSDTVGQVLAAVRLAACYALPGGPARVAIVPGAPREAGQLTMKTSRARWRTVSVSGSATAESIASAAGVAQGRSPHLAQLGALEIALARLTRAMYGRAGMGPATELDSAVVDARQAVKQLAREYGWIGRAHAAFARRTDQRLERSWTR